MAKIRSYRCPGASGHPPHTFDFMHHPSDEPPPRFCPLCGYDSDADDGMVAAIVAPHVSDGRAKALSQSADQTYRAMEDGSAHRAAMASSETGEDASSLKITNLKDNLKMGDIAAPDLPANPVSQVMSQAPGIFGFSGSDSGAEFARTTNSGYSPRAGMKAGSMVRSFHANNAGAIAAAGEKGRY